MMVSIITPYFNGEKHILNTINSVRNQSIQEWEYLIIDDGSKPASNAYLREVIGDEQRIRVHRTENQGIARARNFGYGLTDKRSDFVLFLDHDDVLAPDALEVLIRTLMTNNDYVAAHGLARFLGDKAIAVNTEHVDNIEAWGRRRSYIKQGKVIALQPDESTTFAALAYQCWISTPGQILFRRSILEKSGLYDQALVPADDWEMCLRVSQYGPIGFVNAVVLNWRRHESSVTTQVETRDWNKVNHKIRYRYINDPQVSKEHQRIMFSTYHLFLSKDIQNKIHYGFDNLSDGQIVRGLKQYSYCINPVYKLTALHIRKYV